MLKKFNPQKVLNIFYQKLFWLHFFLVLTVTDFHRPNTLNYSLNPYLGVASHHDLFHSNKDPCKCHICLRCSFNHFPSTQTLTIFLTNGLPRLLAILFVCWPNVKIKYVICNFCNIWYNDVISWTISYLKYQLIGLHGQYLVCLLWLYVLLNF